MTQGCPLAAALFALAVTKPVAEAREAVGAKGLVVGPGGGARDRWYADDGFIVSDSFGHLRTYLTELKRKLAGVGLVLNVGKTLVLSSGAAVPSGLSGLATAVPEGGAINCLGIPVGGADECLTRVEASVRKAVDGVRNIGRLDNPIHVLQALRCGGGWSRIQYLCGSVQLSAERAASVELADCCVLRESMGRIGEGLDGAAWRQATLPAGLGGLGVSSVRDCQNGYWQYMEGVLEAVERRDADGVSSRLTERRKECEAYAKATHKKLVEVSDDVDRVRLRELAQNGGAALSWLHRPIRPELLPAPAVAATLIAMVLGTPIYPARIAECPGSCPTLQRTGRRRPLDVNGVHVHECASTKTPRHNKLRDGLYYLLSQVIPSTRLVVEAAVLSDGGIVTGASADERPIDLGVCPRGSGAWRCIDFRGISVREELLSRAAADGSVLAEAAERAKLGDGRHRHWARVMRTAGHRLVAGGFGPFGGLGKALSSELRQVGRIADSEAAYGGVDDLRVILTGMASLLIQAGSAEGALRLRREAGLPPLYGEKPVKWAASWREDALVKRAASDPRIGSWLIGKLKAESVAGGQ